MRPCVENTFAAAVSEICEGIEVVGEEEFRASTRESLALLKRTSGFVLVQDHLKVIRQGRRSGMKPWGKRPTFVVGRATWQHSVLWYAGAMAHDACHARLYRAAQALSGAAEPAPGTWTGHGAERKCLAFQYQVIEALGGDARLLGYIADCARRPAYQGRSEGLGGWLDYKRRWW